MNLQQQQAAVLSMKVANGTKYETCRCIIGFIVAMLACSYCFSHLLTQLLLRHTKYTHSGATCTADNSATVATS
jgi:hypothetical protein